MSYLEPRFKTPEEQFTLAIEFAGELEDGISVSSGTVSAVEVLSGTTYNSGGTALIGSTSATISGTQARVLVKNGTAGFRYRIDFLITLSDSTKVAKSVLIIVKSPDERYE